VWFEHKNIYSCLYYQSPCDSLLSGSMCKRDIIAEICILMLRSDKISQMKTFHCMCWWSSMPDVEFYRLYNGFRARDLMPCFCRDFAIFRKVCHVFATIFYCPYSCRSVVIDCRWIVGHRMVTSRSCRDVMAASITSARTENARTRTFTSARSMNTKLCHLLPLILI